jgi:hypothetical protein
MFNKKIIYPFCIGICGSIASIFGKEILSD